jgi:glutaredoxin
MEIPYPTEKGFTIYGKEKCTYCIKAKELLLLNNISFLYIDCDKFIEENKDLFLSFIEDIVGKEYRFVPVIFLDNKFIGGFNELDKYVKNIILSFEDNF